MKEEPPDVDALIEEDEANSGLPVGPFSVTSQRGEKSDESAGCGGRSSGATATAVVRQGSSAAESRADSSASLSGNPTGRKCDECGSLSLDQIMRAQFDETVCLKCRRETEAYKTMTKTKAKEEFLLTDDDLRSLKFHHVANPRRIGWSMMKLYLVKHLEELSVQRWKTKEGLEKEKKRRLEERVVKRQKRAKEAMEGADLEDSGQVLRRNISKLRSELQGVGHAESRGSSPEKQKGKRRKMGTKDERTKSIFENVKLDPGFKAKNQQYHSHEYGEERPEAPGSDIMVKSCKLCGFEMKFESF